MRCSWFLAPLACVMALAPLPPAGADPAAAADVPLSAEELGAIVGAELGATTTDSDDPSAENPAPTMPSQCQTLTGSDSSPLTRGLAWTGFRDVSHRAESDTAQGRAQASQRVVSYASPEAAGEAFAALESATRACGDRPFKVLGGWDVVFQPSTDQIDETDLRLHIEQRNSADGDWRCATAYHQQDSFVLGSDVCWYSDSDRTAESQDEAVRRIVEAMLARLA